MNLVAVGDLHAHPWPVFPIGVDGRNEYLNLVERLITVDIVAALRASNLDPMQTIVVFLGDVADEPYRRGKISVAVEEMLIASIRELRQQVAKVMVISGNHDMTSQSLTWFEAHRDVFDTLVLPGTVHVLGSAMLGNGHRLVLVGYPGKDNLISVSETLREPGVAEDALVLGHFGIVDAPCGNGISYTGEEAMFHSTGTYLGEKAWRTVLGHIHSPSGDGRIIYAGLPLNYSWAIKTPSYGSLWVYSEAENVLFPVQVKAPCFYEGGLETNLSLLEGSFVRIRIRHDQLAEFEALRSANQKVNLFPVFVESGPDGADSLRAMASNAASQAITLDQALRAYTTYCGSKGTLPASEDEVLAIFNRTVKP